MILWTICSAKKPLTNNSHFFPSFFLPLSLLVHCTRKKNERWDVQRYSTKHREAVQNMARKEHEILIVRAQLKVNRACPQFPPTLGFFVGFFSVLSAAGLMLETSKAKMLAGFLSAMHALLSDVCCVDSIGLEFKTFSPTADLADCDSYLMSYRLWIYPFSVVASAPLVLLLRREMMKTVIHFGIRFFLSWSSPASFLSACFFLLLLSCSHPLFFHHQFILPRVWAHVSPSLSTCQKRWKIYKKLQEKSSNFST